jgi:hypothetical protein
MSTSKLSNKKSLWIVAAAFALAAIGNLIGALGRTRGTGVWNLEIGGAIILALCAIGIGVEACRAKDRV